MLKPAVNLTDDVVGIDLAARNTVKIGNSGRGHFQAFQLLLGNRVSDGSHIALDVSFGKRGHVCSDPSPRITRVVRAASRTNTRKDEMIMFISLDDHLLHEADRTAK
jgi:hypothetical protein